MITFCPSDKTADIEQALQDAGAGGICLPRRTAGAKLEFCDNKPNTQTK